MDSTLPGEGGGLWQKILEGQYEGLPEEYQVISDRKFKQIYHKPPQREGGEGDRGSEGKIEQRIRGKRLSDRVKEGKEESE